MNYKAKEMVSAEKIDELLGPIPEGYKGRPAERTVVATWLFPLLEAAYAKGRDDERERCIEICEDLTLPDDIEEKQGMCATCESGAAKTIKRRILEPNTKEG